MELESGKLPAPEALAVVQAFVNTIDLEQQRDDLRSPERLRVWLAEHDLFRGAVPVSDADLRRGLEVREAMRAMLEANNGAPLDGSAAVTLNRVAGEVCLHVHIDRHGRAHLEPAAMGVDGALGRLLVAMYGAQADGTWQRLKVCRDDTCRWAFYDTSKNRSGAWCSMAVCGSRAKSRAYRQRRHGAAGPA